MSITKYNFSKIRRKLSKELDEDRFEHTLGVAKTAQLLACIYESDTDKAYMAGLLHDCAKNIPQKDKIKLCKDANEHITELEKENSSLLHAKAGRILAKKEYKIEDDDILNAILSHTTGRPDMSLLEKIVFVSDYIEPGRPYRPNLNNLRKLAFEDIDKCVLGILKDTLVYLSDSAKAIDPMTQITYDYYLNIGNSCNNFSKKEEKTD